MSPAALTVRGVVRALGLRLGDDELEGRWTDPRGAVDPDALVERARQEERAIRREEEAGLR